MATKWLVGTDLGVSASWGTADGGSGGSGVPTSADDACVGPISFPSGNTVLTCTGNAVACRNLIMTNSGLVTIPATATITVNYDATLKNIATGTNWTLSFIGGRDHYLTTNGSWIGYVGLSYSGGYRTYLMDNLTAYRTNITNGAWFDFNGRDATLTNSVYQSSSASCKYFLGSGTIRAAFYHTSGVPGTLDCGTSTLILGGTGTQTSYFPAGATLNILKLEGSTAINTNAAGGSLTIGQLSITSGITISSTSGVSISVGSITQTGDKASVTTIAGTSSAPVSLSSASQIALDNVKLTYCAASGGGLFCASSGYGVSEKDANSTGWYLASPPTSGISILSPSRQIAAAPSTATIAFPDDGGFNIVIPHIQTSQTVAVKAAVSAAALPTGGGVKFILDMGTPAERSAISKGGSSPFSASFSDVAKAEHTLDVYVVDASDSVQPTYHDSAMHVGVGDIFAAVGDSTTAGNPYYVAGNVTNWTNAPAGTVSLDNRNFPQNDAPQSPRFRQSFLDALNNALTASLGYPVFIYNDGNSAYTTADQIARMNTTAWRNRIAALAPNRWMINICVNDALTAVAPDTCKSNIQSIIATSSNTYGGKPGAIFLAKPVYAQNNAPVEALELAYCTKIDEIVASGVCSIGPDFYAYFQAHPEQQADSIHPNAAGYAACASLWLDAITSTANASAASAWLQFVMQ